MNIAHPRPTPHRPGAFSCPHSPGPLVQIIFCASEASLRPLYGVIGEMSTPHGCRREQICSWTILRGVGGIEGLGEYGYVASIFTHADLTEAQGVCYHVICDMLFVYHFFFY